MKLSIITINLNNSIGLQKTIESVINQSSKVFEHIIIDGNSNDNSVEVIESFSGIPPDVYINPSSILGSRSDISCLSRITYWVSVPDNGIYHAMNKGIMVAKGEYCQFLNSGDYLSAPDVIENMLGSLPECGIYYGNMLKILPNGKIYRDKGGEGNITFLTFYKGTINHSSAFIKRSLFDKYKLYDENLKIVSDWKWYLIAIGLNNESVKYANIDITYFDMRGISNTNHELEKQERRIVLEELLPARLLADFDKHSVAIEQTERINHYKVTKMIFWFVERILHKLEKWKIL